MKSTIRVELGDENKPVIRMKVYPTDDVRDILFRQFKEGFHNTSNLCYAAIDNSHLSSDGMDTIIEIQPLPPRSHYICFQRVEEIFKCMQQLYPELTMITGGGTIGFYKGSGPGIELNREDLRNMNIVDLFNEVTNTLNSIINN